MEVVDGSERRAIWSGGVNAIRQAMSVRARDITGSNPVLTSISYIIAKCDENI